MDALGTAVLPRLLAPLSSVFLFAAIFRPDITSAEALHHAVPVRTQAALVGGPMLLTASPIVDDARWPASRCASVCRAPDRRRRSDGSREAKEECGVDLEFSDFGKDARLVGLEFGLGLLPGGPESLGVYGLSEGLEVDFNVVQQQRHTSGDGRPSSSSAPYTVSVRVLDTTAARTAEGSAAKVHPPEYATLRLEACGLSPRSVMGRGASVFVMEAASNGGGDAAEDIQHLFGVFPTFGTGQGGGSSDREHLPVPRRLRNTATTAAAGGSLGGREDGGRAATTTTTAAAAAAVAVSAALERTGTIGHQGRRTSPLAGGGRTRSRRRLQEACSSSCLKSSVDPCVNDPECAGGGIGCNAQGDPLCRFCSQEGEEGSVYSACRDPDEPTPPPVPTPAPTADPERPECRGACRDNPDATFPCFDDPSCGGDSNLLGCNAEGNLYCRFCTIPGAVFDCPFSTATPASTPAPSAGTSDVGTPAPSVVGTSAGATSVPTATPTATPSVAADTNVTSTPLAPLTAAPTLAPVTVLSTPTPSTPSPTTPAPSTPAPATPAPATSAPTATTAAPSAARTGAPTSGPMPLPATTAAPTVAAVAPTAAPAAVPTAAPTVAVGALGPGSVKGSMSASGIPEELVAEKGEERLVQEAVCALSPCPDGPDSVTVTIGGDGDSARMLLSALQGRRRLADIADAVFEVPTPAGAPTGTSTEPLTGSKQAAALFNQAADPDAVAAAAAAFGIPAENLDFGTLEYFEGLAFSISNEFGFVAEPQAEPQGEKEASTRATVVVAIILISAMLLCSCCVFFLMKHHVEKRHGRIAGGFATRSPPRKSAKLSTIDEERGQAVQVGKSGTQAYKSMGPSPHSTLVRFSSGDHPDGARGGSGTTKGRLSSSGRRPKTVPHTQSMGSEESSTVSDKFTYSNPMHKGGEIKNTGSPNEYGDDLAQHYYEGRSEGPTAMSDVSSELPHDKTSNPLFSSDLYRTGLSAASPTSAVEAARARSRGRGGGGGGGGGGSSGYHAESGSGHDSYSDWRSGASRSGTLEPMSPASFDSEPTDDTDGASSFGSGSYQSRGSSRSGGGGGGRGMSLMSETSSRMPFGLSPVAERNGDKGESSGSSSTTGGASTVYHARGGAGAPTSGIPGLGSYGGGGGGGSGSYSTVSGMDDDAESMFRPLSPGSVTRPLQPLLAQQSPLSSASAFDSRSNSLAMSSRSNSFASPKPVSSVAGAGFGQTMLQKGIPTESLKAIKVAHGGDAEREAVREAVRRQRRKIARSMSYESTSSSYQLSPMAEHPEHEDTAAGLSQGDMGSHGSKIIVSRSASMSPHTLARRQNERQHQYGSSGSDLRSVGALSEVPYAGGGGGGSGGVGIGGGSWGGARGPSRATSSYYSEAGLTSASTLTSFNEESTVGSPGAGPKKSRATPNLMVADAEVGSAIFQVSDTASDASADAAGGRGSGGLAASLDRRVKSASVAPSPTYGPGVFQKVASKHAAGGGGDGSVDEDRDEFYDASATPQDAQAAAAAAAAAVEEQAAAARATAAAAAAARAGSRAPKGLRFSSRGRAMGRGRGRRGGRGAASAAGRAAAAGVKTGGDVAGKQKPLSMLSMSKSSSESDSPADGELGALPPDYQSLEYSTGSTGSAAAAAAADAAAAAAGVVGGAGALDETSLKAAQECRDRAVEAGKAAGGAAAATGEAKTEAQLMAAGAAAAAKATKGRQVNDDVRRKAIQAGAAAAAAAAQADGPSYGGGGGGRWNAGSSVGEVKSVLKTAGSFRNTEKRRSVSFADGSSSEFDTRVSRSDDDHGVGGMRGFRQHLADPGQPSGSYRRQESDESSGFSNESLSPSVLASSMTGGASHQASFDTVSTYSAASVASFATTATSTNFSTAGRGATLGSESSQSDSDVDWPTSTQRNPGATGGSAAGVAVGQRPISWTSTADMEEQEAGAVRREASAEAAAAKAAGYSPAEVGATTASAAEAEEGQKYDSAVSTYNKLFSTGGRPSSGRSSSSGESKRRMVMR